MRCSYCGSELRERKLYCDNCGKEVQIVPDYNEFEEDYLNNVLLDDEASEDEEVLAMSDEEIHRREEKSKRTRKQREIERQKELKKKKILMIVSIVALVIFVGLIIFFVVKITTDNQHDTSYAYQLEQGKIAEKKNDVSSAINYYEKASSIDKEDIVVRYLLANLYMKQKDYNKVIVVCSEILSLSNNEYQAYEYLLEAYEGNSDFKAIKDLAAKAPSDDSILNLFSKYIVVAPTPNFAEGSYDNFMDLELSAGDGAKIYYTDNGEDPTGSSGILYTKPISFSETGTFKIRAVSVNEKGIYSDIVVLTYVIDLAAPVTPNFTTAVNGLDENNNPIVGAFYIVEPTLPDPVDPESTENPGEIVDKTPLIMINVPENCDAYYEWNKETPSVASTKYDPQKGIPMLEGTNIFYVIFIDQRNEKCSSIKSKNFEYFAE